MWVVKKNQAKTRNNNTVIIDKQVLKNLNAPYFQTDTYFQKKLQEIQHIGGQISNVCVPSFLNTHY